MKLFEDEIVRAINRRFAPDFATALRDADPMMVASPLKVAQLPLLAGVNVLYEHDLASFIIDATLTNKDPLKYMRGRSIFSNRELLGARDKVGVIEYCFERAKHQFIDSIVNEELDLILASCRPRTGA